jgi:hypothetical protein
MRPQTRDAIAGCPEAEGDRIARMVLELVRAIAQDRSVEPVRPEPEPVHTSPVYREYERLVGPATTPRAS